MARRADPPGVQAAKGNPGKRKSAAQKRDAEALRIAELLARAPAESAEAHAAPAFVEERFPAALAVWREYAPRLAQTNRLSPMHRHTFALFCVYMAEWVAANEDIASNGYDQRVKTVAGGFMWRKRPSVERRERAFANVMELSQDFGFTPLDEYALFKDQALAVAQNPGLFGQARAAPVAASDAANAAAQTKGSLIGGLARLDSAPPPGSRPN